MHLQIFYDAPEGEFRSGARQHFTKMPNLKEIIVYGKPSEVFEKYHPILYDACVDDDVSLKLYRVDRDCGCCNPKGLTCDDFLHFDTEDGEPKLTDRKRMQIEAEEYRLWVQCL